MRRRQLLSLVGAAGVAGVATACGANEPPEQPKVALDTPLRIPPLLEDDGGGDGARRFALEMRTGTSRLLPGKRTRTWGFNGAMLGPTIRAKRGDRVRMEVRNRLPETSTVHWHGMRLPAVMDGGPHQPIEPGAAWRPEWTLDQPATTAWYHPHPHGSTAKHVYRGLAGLFVIDEDGGPELPSEYGVDDVPVILQDKLFTEDGQLDGDPRKGTFGILGDRVLVNATYSPKFEVTTERVRLRVLNGSNARMYNLVFADRRSFAVVGNDAGLLGEPVRVKEIALTPGERAELVVDFEPGDDVVLRSRDNGVDIAAGDLDLLRLTAARRLEPSPEVPAKLVDLPRITPPPGARVRRFELNGSDAINGEEMEMTRIDEVVPAGAVEIWEVENNVYSHNFHIHEVAFQVLESDGKPPPAYATGHKDTVFVPGKSKVKLAVAFGGFTDPRTPYMYHCHILRHEDQGMMGQFVIVEPGTERSVKRTLPNVHGH